MSLSASLSRHTSALQSLSSFSRPPCDRPGKGCFTRSGHSLSVAPSHALSFPDTVLSGRPSSPEAPVRQSTHRLPRAFGRQAPEGKAIMLAVILGIIALAGAQIGEAIAH